jgi:hypothetical protein
VNENRSAKIRKPFKHNKVPFFFSGSHVTFCNFITCLCCCVLATVSSKLNTRINKKVKENQRNEEEINDKENLRKKGKAKKEINKY